MSNDVLFPGAELEGEGGEAVPAGAARYQAPQRDQMLLLPSHLDGLVASDHRARLVWSFVKALDLSPFYARIRSVEGHAGRPAIDPAILMALWLYATVEGIGSARALARLCEEHVAYRWICGGVSVNAHTLADFRTSHGAELDRLLTESLAALMTEGLVTLERVAQDGMRVRASAGAASFRSQDALGRCLEEAQEQIEALRREVDQDPQATARRQAAARERGARDRSERIRRAIHQREEAAKRKSADDEKGMTRASTTDPEARVMKMGDGGYRPAYNAPLATDTQSQLIVGVDVSNVGSDLGQMAPMVEQVEERTGRRPAEVLVDGGFAKLQDIETVEQQGTTVYAPVQRPRDPQRDPHAPRPSDGPEVAAWRKRMASADAKRIHRNRAATAECVNAIARNRGLVRVLVRGRDEVRAVVLWFALAHDMMRAVALRATAGAG
jgi:transposase